jgi:hypothetical protein
MNCEPDGEAYGVVRFVAHDPAAGVGEPQPHGPADLAGA